MLYFFDPAQREIDPLESADAGAAGVREDEIEKALARRPGAIFRAVRVGAPVLVVRTSTQGVGMADVIALDAQGRLVLIECKRGYAKRDTLAQLLDYASAYAPDPFARLQADWEKGEGAKSRGDLLEHFREFADDQKAEKDTIGKDQVLVVVAAAQDEGFKRIASYMEARGVPVHFVCARLFRRGNGDLFLEVEPVDLDSKGSHGDRDGQSPVWMINTDETHSPGAHIRFLEAGVAAIWGYQDGPTTLEQGAVAGEKIYAYLNGTGIIAEGSIADGEVYAAPPGKSVFPENDDPGNEWHMRVLWKQLPKSISAADVRSATGAGLPVRNTFCRLWNEKVRDFIEQRTR